MQLDSSDRVKPSFYRRMYFFRQFWFSLMIQLSPHVPIMNEWTPMCCKVPLFARKDNRVWPVFSRDFYLCQFTEVLMMSFHTSFSVWSSVCITFCPSSLLLLSACSPLPMAMFSLTSPSPLSKRISCEAKEVKISNATCWEVKAVILSTVDTVFYELMYPWQPCPGTFSCKCLSLAMYKWSSSFSHSHTRISLHCSS